MVFKNIKKTWKYNLDLHLGMIKRLVAFKFFLKDFLIQKNYFCLDFDCVSICKAFLLMCSVNLRVDSTEY